MKIPILDLGPEIDAHFTEFNEAFQRVLKSGHFIMGPEVRAFEQEIADYLGVKHAIGCNSGTDALVIGLRALGVGVGAEVICPAFTFFATAEAVSLLGATPVFVDVDPTTFCIDVAKIAEKITPRTKAIVPVHLFGHSADMPALHAVVQGRDIMILEDVAQAMGGAWNRQKLGSIGHAGAFSFFPSKNLGAFGDGGLITTNDPAVADTCAKLRAHGSKKKYFNELIGYNSRLDEMQAAFLRIKLGYLEESNEGRRKVANRYGEAFTNKDGITAPTERAPAHHVYHQYTLRIDGNRRDKVQAALEAQGINTMIYYPVPLHRLPVYRHMTVSLPVTERLADEVISLPIWPQMKTETQIRVVEAILGAL